MAVNNVDFEAAVEKRLQAARDLILAPYAQKMEQYAKAEAKWTDRTHNLRNGIQGSPFYNPGVDMGITLAHTYWYGIFVEKVHGPPNPDPKKRHSNEWWEDWARNSSGAAAYLETANDSRFAVLRPTVEHFMPEIKKELSKLFGGKG